MKLINIMGFQLLMLFFGACNASSQSHLRLVKRMYPANIPFKEKSKMSSFEGVLQRLINANHEQMKNRTQAEILKASDENIERLRNFGKTDAEIQEKRQKIRDRINRAIAKSQGRMTWTEAAVEDFLQRLFRNEDYEEQKERTMQEIDEIADRNNKKMRKALVKAAVGTFVVTNLPHVLALGAGGAIAHAVAAGAAKGCIVGLTTGCAGEISDRRWENQSIRDSIKVDQKMLYEIGSEALKGAVAGAALYGTATGIGQQEFLENMMKPIEPMKEEFHSMYKSLEGISDEVLDQFNDSGVNKVTNDFVEELGEYVMQSLLEMPCHHH